MVIFANMQKRLESQKIWSKTASDADTQQLIHELQVHQIEFEMQNGELREDQEKLEDSRNKYYNLYDCAPIGYFSCDQKGIIFEMNLNRQSYSYG